MNIVFTSRKSSPDFLKTAIQCAKFFNPKAEIIHAGHECLGIETTFYSYYDYMGNFKYMEQAGTFGPNTVWQETSSIARWVVIDELIKLGKLSSPFIAVDWDVLIVRDLDEVWPLWNEYDYTLAHEISPGETMIFNPEVISEFHRMLEGAYIHGTTPEILDASQNDMSLWRIFKQQYPQFKCGDTDEIRGGSWCDCNITLHGDIFKMDPKTPAVKLLTFRNNQVFLQKHDGQFVRLNNIHCWCTKPRMEEWYRRAIS